MNKTEQLNNKIDNQAHKPKVTIQDVKELSKAIRERNEHNSNRLFNTS